MYTESSHIHTHAHTCKNTCTHIHQCTHTHIHIHMHTHTLAHIHTLMHQQQCVLLIVMYTHVTFLSVYIYTLLTVTYVDNCFDTYAGIHVIKECKAPMFAYTCVHTHSHMHTHVHKHTPIH